MEQEGISMTTAVLLVRTRPATPEAEDDYNDWYERVHIPQILAAVPAIISAQRFRLLSSHGRSDGSAPYLAVYEIESDDPAGALDQLGRAMATGEIAMSPSVEVLGPAPLYVEPSAPADAESP
jgi:hypothetical protein